MPVDGRDVPGCGENSQTGPRKAAWLDETQPIAENSTGLRYRRASGGYGLPSKAILANMATGPINGGRSVSSTVYMEDMVIIASSTLTMSMLMTPIRMRWGPASWTWIGL